MSYSSKNTGIKYKDSNLLLEPLCTRECTRNVPGMYPEPLNDKALTNKIRHKYLKNKKASRSMNREALTKSKIKLQKNILGDSKKYYKDSPSIRSYSLRTSWLIYFLKSSSNG